MEAHVSRPVIAKWETGERAPNLDDLASCETKLGTRGYLGRILTEWVSREVSPEWFEWRGVVEDATEVLNYENVVVPGLLQTPEYARAVLPSDDMVAQRLERQQIFEKEDSPAYEALIDESVLYRKVGSAETMVEQLRHLLSMTERGDLSIRVIPLSANADRFTYPFSLATIGNGKQIGYPQGTLRGRIMERPEDVAELRRYWLYLSALALSRDDSIKLIQTTIDERWGAE